VGGLEEGLRTAVALGQAAPGVEPWRDAALAAALADGLAWHMLCAPAALLPDEAIAALDAHLDHLMPRAGND
jgi:BetI-type transcriptional repressor, C-terminal